MSTQPPHRIKTISEYHEFMGLPKPQHPLISVVRFEDVKRVPTTTTKFSLVMDCYSISLKRSFNAKMTYGQQSYDFDEGIMFFLSPGQGFGIEVKEGAEVTHNGWMLLIHPDFLWNTQLAKTSKDMIFLIPRCTKRCFSQKKKRTP